MSNDTAHRRRRGKDRLRDRRSPIGRATCSRRERLPRAQFLPFLAQQPAATVVMEACGSAHYWGRRIEQLGHRVVLLPPHHVRPYVRGNKTDRTDAKGILEACRNEDIRPVPVKTVAQQVADVAAPAALGLDDGAHGAPQHPPRPAARARRLHPRRARARSCRRCGRSSRTPTPSFPTRCAPSSPRPARRSATSRRASSRSSGSWRRSPSRLPAVERLLHHPRHRPAHRHRARSPSSATSGASPRGGTWPATSGLTPREYSSGLKRHLGRISKRGDGYLRTLLIHGARSVLAPRAQAAAGPAARVGAQAREDPRPQQGRRGRRQQDGAHRLGGLERARALRH